MAFSAPFFFCRALNQSVFWSAELLKDTPHVWGLLTTCDLCAPLFETSASRTTTITVTIAKDSVRSVRFSSPGERFIVGNDETCFVFAWRIFSSGFSDDLVLCYNVLQQYVGFVLFFSLLLFPSCGDVHMGDTNTSARCISPAPGCCCSLCVTCLKG